MEDSTAGSAPQLGKHRIDALVDGIFAVAVPLAGLFPGSANFAFLLLFGLNPVSRAVARRASKSTAPAA